MKKDRKGWLINMRRGKNELKALKNERLCPVCGETTLKYYTDICLVCGWEHDFLQSDDHNSDKVANNLSVTDAKEWFNLKRILDPNYRWEHYSRVDGNPTKEDLESLRIKVKGKN